MWPISTASLPVAGSLQFEMGPDFNYEPTQADSIAARAAAAGVTGAEYAYDLLMKDEGKGFIYFPILNYRDGNLNFLEALARGRRYASIRCPMAARIAERFAMRLRPPSCCSIGCATAKRKRISLEHAVKRQCRDTALLYGLDDRGLIAPGYLADINVIDLDALKLGKPWLAFDLPAGGKRLLQKADGYVCTIKSGQVTFRNGDYLGVHPGKLLRGPQQAPLAIAAE